MTEQPGPPNGTRHHCPLETTCSWYLDVPPTPAFGPNVLADVFGQNMLGSVAVARWRSNAERELTEHFNTHSTLEFIAEIAKLRELSIGLAEQLAEMGKLYQAAAARNES